MILPLAILYSCFMYYFWPVFQISKQLESVSRSPVYVHFSDTLSRLSTIRSYGQEDQFIEEFEVKADKNTRAYWKRSTQHTQYTHSHLLLFFPAYLFTFRIDILRLSNQEHRCDILFIYIHNGTLQDYMENAGFYSMGVSHAVVQRIF